MSVLAVVLIVLEALVICLLMIRNGLRPYDGNMVVYNTDEKKTFTLEIKSDLDKLDTKKSITLRVIEPPS